MLPADEHLSVRLRARALQLISALEKAGGAAVSGKDLHAFAYLANVLSPLWELEPLDGSILKDDDGPYYPTLQKEIDFLIGNSIVTVVTLERIKAGARNILGASFILNRDKSNSILECINRLPDESRFEVFLLELASAFLEINKDQRDDAALYDAAYSDPAISTGRIVDFAEWVSSTTQNPSWNAAQSFQQYMPAGITLSPAEKLVMYMRLLKRRAHG